MSVTDCGFPRAARLIEQHEFSAVFAAAQRSADRFFTVLGHNNGATEARLGLAISRKAARHAVQRNRLKRIAREVFRHHRGALAGLDLVVMAKPAAVNASNAELRQSLEQHCEGIPDRCAGS